MGGLRAMSRERPCELLRRCAGRLWLLHCVYEWRAGRCARVASTCAVRRGRDQVQDCARRHEGQGRRDVLGEDCFGITGPRITARKLGKCGGVGEHERSSLGGAPCAVRGGGAEGEEREAERCRWERWVVPNAELPAEEED